ncbi:MAG: hypothetical protein M3124_01635 [Actinomycetota bacterium]|nr:hypothetical protein [Actinomycetota bacterium]
MSKEPDHGVVIRLSQQASDGATNQRTVAPTPSLPDTRIDMTDEVAPSDFPILVLLREKVGQLQAENDGLRQQLEVEHSRSEQLDHAVDRERDRANHAEAENKNLLKRVRRLEAELAKLRSKDLKRGGSDEQIGLFRSVLRIPWNRLPSEVIAPASVARIETFGKMAHLHQELTERNNGQLTLGESLELRRAHYGDRVRASAALFGKRMSHTILYRDVPEGKRPEPSDPVRLTEEGKRLAAAYRRHVANRSAPKL